MVWYKLQERKPIATESGDWDGLRSSKVLVGTMAHTIHIATMYEGMMGSEYFCNFVDENDFEINNVILWAEIDMPF